MTYEELLRQPQWHEKCHEILLRDTFKCEKCHAYGYHADLIQEFNEISEVNSFIEGFIINGMTLSEFINDDMKDDKRFSVPTMLWHDSPSKWQGYYLYRCGGLMFRNATLIRTKQELTTYEEELNDHESYQKKKFKAKIRIISGYDNNIKVQLPKGLDTNLEYITSVKFNDFISEKIVLTIERVTNTGGYASPVGYVFSWGNIVISVTYKNYAISFYLTEQRHYENDKNGHSDFHKPLNNPIICRGLNIHHIYYVKGNLPWNYDNEALVTLCEICHKQTHKTIKTPVYKRIIPTRLIDSYARICDRCGGGGYLPQFDYYYDGICFKCWGEGVFIDDDSTKSTF